MKTPRKQPSPLSDVLKRAIAACGLPMLTISNESGVARPSLIRFMSGERSLRLDKADKLAAYFGLELVAKRKGNK